MQNVFDVWRIVRITRVGLDIKEYLLLVRLIVRPHVSAHLHLLSIVPLIIFLQADVDVRFGLCGCIVSLHVPGFHNVGSRCAEVWLVFLDLHLLDMLVLLDAFKWPLRRCFGNCLRLTWLHATLPFVLAVTEYLGKLLIIFLSDGQRANFLLELFLYFFIDVLICFEPFHVSATSCFGICSSNT